VQKYEKLYESLIPLKMESLEEILITSDGEEEQEQEQTVSSFQLAEPRATSPSSCNGPPSSSPLLEMSSLPAEPVFQCPLDSCNFIIAQEVRLLGIYKFFCTCLINMLILPGRLTLHSIFYINKKYLEISEVSESNTQLL
jgi:hypothetical protein